MEYLSYKGHLNSFWLSLIGWRLLQLKSWVQKRMQISTIAVRSWWHECNADMWLSFESPGQTVNLVPFPMVLVQHIRCDSRHTDHHNVRFGWRWGELGVVRFFRRRIAIFVRRRWLSLHTGGNFWLGRWLFGRDHDVVLFPLLLELRFFVFLSPQFSMAECWAWIMRTAECWNFC